MKEIEILTECHDEEVVAVIVAAIQEMLSDSEKTTKLPGLLRDKVNVPIWNFQSRQNNLL